MAVAASGGDLPVYWNGRIVPAGEARPGALAPGFLYGESLFETILDQGGTVFALDEHLDRLLAGARRLGWHLGAGRAELAAAIPAAAEAVRASGLLPPRAPLRVRLTVACAAEWWEGAPPDRFDVLVSAVPYRPDETAARRGWRAKTVRFRLDPRHPLAGLKSGNYWPYRLARAEARASGADEALLLTIDGLVAEGSVANVFIFEGERLLTPPLACGILPGVTRSAVLSLAERLGIPVAEEAFPPGRLLGADEAFLTNSLVGIVPLVAVDGWPVGDGRPGPCTARLAAALAELVGQPGSGRLPGRRGGPGCKRELD